MVDLGGRFFDDESTHLDRFGPLLALTVVTVGAMSLIEFSNPNDAVWPSVASTFLAAVIGITFLLALRASGVARKWRLAADVFVALGGALSITFLVIDLSTDADLSAFESDRPSPIWVAIAIVTPVAIVRRLIRHRRVTAGTLLGAISAYLLVAVGYAYAFLYVDAAESAAFFAETADPPTTSFMYFSLVTITTLGYGDLAPATEVGRLMATSEAVIGQVYLVTFVAMLVGLLIQQRDRTGSDAVGFFGTDSSAGDEPWP